MTRSAHRRVGVVVAVGTLSLAGTGSVVSATTPPPTTDPAASGVVEPSGPLCRGMAEEGEGSLVGMADDPAAIAANNNPLLSRLAAMVTATGLGDTLNEGPLTVFAPINSAFDKIDPATLEGLLGDTEMLTGILLHHVIPEQLSSADLVAGGTFVTAHGHDAALTVSLVGETLVINGGEAAVLCADVPTANATVYLIDTVLTPPANEPVDTTEPVGDTTEPVVETTEPVVETSEPLIETTVPGTVTDEPDEGGQIEFPEGSSETSVEGTTSNQSFDSWSVSAESGQLLEVSVTSAEGNVTFDVFSVDGEVLADDQTSFSGQVPADGLYAIEVGTGANSADYTLNVAVTG
jgi:uncharacterized surface protein with fasciclin (FAS1) repeats